MKSKYTLIAALLLILASCKNEKVKSVKDAKADTSAVLGVFVSLGGDRVEANQIFRVISPFLRPDTNDITKNKLMYDTAYFVPGNALVVDSLNKPVLDSLSKPIYRYGNYLAPKGSVWDSNIKVDSAIVGNLGRKFIRRPLGNPDTLRIRK